MSTVRNDLKRRTFLAAAICTPALAVAALIMRRRSAVEAVLPVASDPAEGGSGYHETDHIRTYYRTAAYF